MAVAFTAQIKWIPLKATKRRTKSSRLPIITVIVTSRRMGRLVKAYLTGEDVFKCAQCHCHLALASSLESNTFQSGHHRAYLLTAVVNVGMGAPVTRQLRTGQHCVSDIFCLHCGSEVGWYYRTAYEQSQKYKEGKYILVDNRIIGTTPTNTTPRPRPSTEAQSEGASTRTASPVSSQRES